MNRTELLRNICLLLRHARQLRMDNDSRVLEEAIYHAAKKAFLDLFRNGEHFYYCALIIVGEVYAPFVSAWSREAFAKAQEDFTAKYKNERWFAAEKVAPLLKWSYADSPYDLYGYDAYFGEVVNLFNQRTPVFDDDTNTEYFIRIRAMIAAMRRLDEEGIFSRNQPRNEVFINVEMMPPDMSNLEYAIILNPPEAMREWFADCYSWLLSPELAG